MHFAQDAQASSTGTQGQDAHAPPAASQAGETAPDAPSIVVNTEVCFITLASFS